MDGRKGRGVHLRQHDTSYAARCFPGAIHWAREGRVGSGAHGWYVDLKIVL